MIRIIKPATGPRILTGSNNRGPKTTAQMKNDYDNKNKRDFDFDSNIYGAKSVKDKLIAAQHDKCCFCEARITHIAYGDVEHFRPKGGWIQKEGDALSKPGYYWLAYDWSNLFLSCQKCNQRHKKNKFPLATSARRATSHHASVANEDPLFIHPADDDPEQFIGFRDEVPYAVDGNARGDATIVELGLKRQELSEDRSNYLALPKLLLRTFKQYKTRDSGVGPTLTTAERSHMQEVYSHLLSLRQMSSEYSSMMKAALQSLP